MSFAIDEALTLERIGERTYSAENSEHFWNFDSAFGGWVSALAFRALTLEPDYRGELVTQNIQFHSAVRAPRLLLRLSLRERRRSVDFWQVEIIDQQQPEQIISAATFVVGVRQASDLSYEKGSDAIKDRSECVRLRGNEQAPRWFEHYEQWLASDNWFGRNANPRTVVYIREADKRVADTLSLVAMLDSPAPRSFFITDERRFGATLSLSNHFYASHDEIAQVGSDFMILECDSDVIRHGFINQQVRLLRADGLLLATSYQTGIHR
jgi:hypothetical protein